MCSAAEAPILRQDVLGVFVYLFLYIARAMSFVLRSQEPHRAKQWRLEYGRYSVDACKTPNRWLDPCATNSMLVRHNVRQFLHFPFQLIIAIAILCNAACRCVGEEHFNEILIRHGGDGNNARICCTTKSLRKWFKWLAKVREMSDMHEIINAIEGERKPNLCAVRIGRKKRERESERQSE